MQTQTTNFQWQEILFPLVTRVVVEGTSRSSGTGKETAWLENVQRLAGSCLDRGFGRNRTARGPGEGERMPLSEGRSEEDEEISRRSSLYPRDLKPNGGGRSLKKRIYNLLLAEPLKDSPRYWKNIRKGGRHTVPVDTTPVPQYLVNIKVRILRRPLVLKKDWSVFIALDFAVYIFALFFDKLL